jgi:ribonuclease HII
LYRVGVNKEVELELIAGVDEAGRGALAGPVISSAVILPEKYNLPGLNDSKLLSPKKREKLFDDIKNQAIAVGIGIADEKVIDKTNILRATFTSMQRALGECKQQPDKALIDGNALPNQIIPNEGVINGDAFVPSIQAASIIAKVTRDRLIIELGDIFPEYGFLYHKGYGTKKHMEALNEWKASPIHRKTFAPVKKNLPSIKWYTERQKIGWIGKKLAALHLWKRKHKIIILNNNSHTFGEIDIISKNESLLVFSIVETVVCTSHTVPDNQIGRKELYRLIKAIDSYLKKNPTKRNIRLDTVLVNLYKGNHKINRIKGIKLD